VSCASETSPLLYDCDVSQPVGTFCFAEFLRINDGKIQEIKLFFDATGFTG
jgi:hypothetical protein